MKLSKHKCLSLKKGLFLIGVMLFSLNSIAQTSDTQQYNELSSALDGVFQIQMVGIRNKPSYDTSLLVEINSKQKQSQRVVFFYKNNIRIEVLSKDEVQNGLIFSQDEKVIYVNQ